MDEILPKKGKSMEDLAVERDILSTWPPSNKGFPFPSRPRLEGGENFRGRREIAEPVSRVKTCPVARQGVVSKSYLFWTGPGTVALTVPAGWSLKPRRGNNQACSFLPCRRRYGETSRDPKPGAADYSA